MPGTKPCQMPLEASGASGVAFASQPLKEPTTWTLRTSGAQTAKCQPATPSWTSGWAPSFSQLRFQVPVAKRYRSLSVMMRQGA